MVAWISDIFRIMCSHGLLRFQTKIHHFSEFRNLNCQKSAKLLEFSDLRSVISRCHLAFWKPKSLRLFSIISKWGPYLFLAGNPIVMEKVVDSFFTFALDRNRFWKFISHQSATLQRLAPGSLKIDSFIECTVRPVHPS